MQLVRISAKNKFAASVSAVLVFLSVINFSGCALAAENGKAVSGDSMYKIDEIVISADADRETFFDVPANITVITSEDIREKNIMTVTDALKGAPGIFVDRPKGIADTTGGIEMRGFTENDIMVLYDGTPMNSAYDGGVDWSAIPVDNIDRIEIAKGAAFPGYGGRGVAGVINIITADPAGSKIKTRVTSYYGTNNTWRRGLSVSQKLNNKFSYYIGYENESTDGFSNKVASSTASGSQYPTNTVGTGLVVSTKVDGTPRYIIGTTGNCAGSNENFNIKFKYDFDAQKTLSYSYTHNKFKYWSEDPESYIYDASGNKLYTGSVQLPSGKWYNFSESAFTDYYGRRTTDIHSLRYSDNGNNLYFGIGYTDIKDAGYSTGYYLDGDTPGKDTSYPSESIKADFRKIWNTSDRNILTAGFDWQNQKMTRTNSLLDRWHDKDSVSAVSYVEGGKNDLLGFFIQDEYSLSDKWELYLGLRCDHYRQYDGYHLESDNNVEYADSIYNELSPKIAVKYEADSLTSYYLSYGRSFNPPSIYKIYRSSDTYVGNPDLKPEISDTAEIGMTKKFGGNAVLNISVYKADTDNMIIAETAPAPYSDKKWYNNVKKAYRTGFDFDLRYRFSKQWSGYVNYSWVRAEDGEGDIIYDIPRSIFHAGLSYRYDKWTATLSSEYISSRNSPGEISGVYLSYDAYLIADIEITYRVSEKCRMAFNVSNIFDENYYLMYAAPGRTCTLGLQFEF